MKRNEQHHALYLTELAHACLICAVTEEGLALSCRTIIINTLGICTSLPYEILKAETASMLATKTG
jgi:hypothetical protein